MLICLSGVSSMVKKIDVTEIGISISRIIRLFLYNFRIIFSFFIIGTLLSYVYMTSPFVSKGNYSASGFVTHTSNGNTTIQNTIIQAINSDELAELVASKLEEDEISLPDGTFLSAETIKSNLTFASIPNTLKINITFVYPDEILSVSIINEFIEQLILYANTTFPNLGNGVTLGEYAITSSLVAIPYSLYLSIGSLIGLFVGLFFGILIDSLKGTIYSPEDIKEFLKYSFNLPMKIKTKLNPDRFLNMFGLGKKLSFEQEQTKLILQGLVASSSFTTIQNNLESTRNKPEEPLTTLMVTPMPISNLSMVAFAYGRQSSTQGRKTILIDFDLKDVPFTKYLEKYHIETKKKPSSKESISFLALEENLDLYLPLQDIIPAKVIRDEETKDIITQIKKKYDHIIILGPSLLPDNSNISILNYVNSALIIAKASKSTIMEVIKSVNLLIENQLTAIETLVLEEKIMTEFPSLSLIQSWFKFKTKPKPTTPVLQKSTKKK